MKKGFTLVELMAVIILLGALSLVAVPAVNHYIESSREKSYEATVSKLKEAATNWYMEYGGSISWTNSGDKKTYELQLATIKNSEFLTNEDIKNPKTGENLDGCFLISKDNTTERVTYQFYEGCAY